MFLNGKAKVMDPSTRVNFQPGDFPPLGTPGSKVAVNGDPSPSSSRDAGPPLQKVDDQKACWSSLFGTNLSPTLQFHEPVICEGKTVVKVSYEVNAKGFVFMG